MYINFKIVHVCADLGLVVGGGEGDGAGAEQRGKVDIPHTSVGKVEKVKRGSRQGGGEGEGFQDPLENHKLFGVL